MLGLSSLRGHPCRAPASRGLLLAILLSVAAGGALAEPPASQPGEAERLVFLLQYIAVDYGAAVQDGKIVNASEYQEMRAFSQLLVDRFADLQARGASEEIRRGLLQLREKIREARPWTEVRALASALAGELTSELDLIALPAAAPDVERGRRLYGRICVTCHGASGGGDGPAAAGMEPPPAALNDSRMNLLSPHQMHGAIRFGIEGTAMPSYEGSLDPERIWDIAFFLMTLRSGFAPRPPEQEVPLTLDDLARHSNEDLLALLRDSGLDVDPGQIDHYRRFPGLARPSAHPRERVAEPAPPSGVARPGSPAAGEDLRVALQLQDAFASVAEHVAPGVVGVTGYVRGADGRAPGRRGAGTWREGPIEERLYPGFRRARSGSGFLVSDGGYILTAGHLLVDDAGKPVDVVDIELDAGEHRIARIVGTEPTIDLGVLKLEAFDPARTPELHPVRIGDSDAVRVGHWTIALGNPAGPGTTFAVGTLSSRPERQCYQEERTATLMRASLGVPAGGYGGPLVNIEGAVVGMMIPGPGADLSTLVAASRSPDFALPINLAMAIYEPLKARESRRSPWLGFSVLELRAARKQRASRGGGAKLPASGVYIDDVFEPSPAAAADIRIGDSLLSIDGNRLTSVAGFQKWLYLSGIGRTITLEISRDGRTIQKRVTVEERPEAAVPR